ncbi:MAG: TadE family protein [Bdellovibrionota bacterium]
MDEQGSVIAEAGLVCFLLALLFTGVFEGSRLIRAHILLSEAAHEAGRLGSRIASLPADSSGSLHEFIANRAQAVLDDNGGLQLENVRISSACEERVLGNGVQAQSVSIIMKADYTGLLAGYLRVPLTINNTASYLGGQHCS